MPDEDKKDDVETTDEAVETDEDEGETPAEESKPE